VIKYAKFKLIKESVIFSFSQFFSSNTYSFLTEVQCCAVYSMANSVLECTVSCLCNHICSRFSSSYFHLSTKCHFMNSSVEKVSFNEEPESQFSLTVRAKF